MTDWKGVSNEVSIVSSTIYSTTLTSVDSLCVCVCVCVCVCFTAWACCDTNKTRAGENYI